MFNIQVNYIIFPYDHIFFLIKIITYNKYEIVLHDGNWFKKKNPFYEFLLSKNTTLTFWILENLRWEKSYNTISTINLSPPLSPPHSFPILQAKQLFCVPISILIFSCRCVSYVPHYLNNIQCQVLSILWLICHSNHVLQNCSAEMHL